MSCGCEVSQEEIEVLKYTFETILKSGMAPSIDECCSSLKKSRKEIIHTFDELERKDILLRKRGTQEIISIYPLSLIPTEHRIILENGNELFAMCAVDALGMPAMFSKNVTIISKCTRCKKEITIEIRNAEITSMSHPDVTIYSPMSQVAPAAQTCCPSVNFFCSTQHAQKWVEEDPKRAGRITQISNQTFRKIKECWKSYGKMLGYN